MTNYKKLWKEFYKMIKDSLHDEWHRFELLDAMDDMEREQ